MDGDATEEGVSPQLKGLKIHLSSFIHEWYILLAKVLEQSSTHSFFSCAASEGRARESEEKKASRGSLNFVFNTIIDRADATGCPNKDSYDIQGEVKSFSQDSKAQFG